MAVSLDHSVHAADTRATLYVRGGLSATGASVMPELCASLPRTVQILRVDLYDVTTFDPDALDALNRLVQLWCAERGGLLHLTLSRALVTDACARLPQANEHWSSTGHAQPSGEGHRGRDGQSAAKVEIDFVPARRASAPAHRSPAADEEYDWCSDGTWQGPTAVQGLVDHGATARFLPALHAGRVSRRSMVAAAR
jgi:hypothetical protein